MMRARFAEFGAFGQNQSTDSAFPKWRETKV